MEPDWSGSATTSHRCHSRHPVGALTIVTIVIPRSRGDQMLLVEVPVATIHLHRRTNYAPSVKTVAATMITNTNLGALS